MIRSKRPRSKLGTAGWGGKREGAGRRRKLTFSERRDIASAYFNRMYDKPKDDPDLEMQNDAPRREAVIRKLMTKHRVTHRMIVPRLSGAFIPKSRFRAKATKAT
jgi:hypothetical protein